jgi:hypothetical protein
MERRGQRPADGSEHHDCCGAVVVAERSCMHQLMWPAAAKRDHAFQKQLLLSVDWGEVVGKDLWPKVVRVLVLAAAPRSRSWQAIVTDEKV